MKYESTNGPVDITFDNTTLPQTMDDSKLKTLILKNTTLAKELKTAQLGHILSSLPYKNLRIHSLPHLVKIILVVN